jgi:hypothetical protein
MVSAGVIGFGNGPSSDAVVSAAGTGSTVGVPSTVTVPPPSTPPPAAPTSTIRTTTTLPRAAVEVLKAIGTTAPPTTAPPATTTTRAPVTTTTPTTQPPTTTTTTRPVVVVPVKVVNAHGQPLVVAINGRVILLDVGQTVDRFEVTLLATGDDVIQAGVQGDAECIVRGDADYFQAGGSYQVTIAADPDREGCGDYPAPGITVAPLP